MVKATCAKVLAHTQTHIKTPCRSSVWPQHLVSERKWVASHLRTMATVSVQLWPLTHSQPVRRKQSRHHGRPRPIAHCTGLRDTVHVSCCCQRPFSLALCLSFLLVLSPSVFLLLSVTLPLSLNFRYLAQSVINATRGKDEMTCSNTWGQTLSSRNYIFMSLNCFLHTPFVYCVDVWGRWLRRMAGTQSAGPWHLIHGQTPMACYILIKKHGNKDFCLRFWQQMHFS